MTQDRRNEKSRARGQAKDRENGGDAGRTVASIRGGQHRFADCDVVSYIQASRERQ